MKLKKKLGHLFRKHPTTTLKLFDALVRPILLYASDFWGVLKMPKNNPVETLFLSFCKQLLGVQKQTVNTGVLLELGQFPIPLHAKTNALKNWNRIAKLHKSNIIVRQSYLSALEKELSWPCQVKNTLSEIGMLDSFTGNRVDNNCHLRILQRLKDIFHQNSFAQINEPNSKLRTYKLLKLQIGFEEYLKEIPNERERICLTKFRLSNHQLMIEKGRHLNLDRKQRLCPFCPDSVEDEKHFLIECKAYKENREILFTDIKKKFYTFHLKNHTEKMTFLLSNKNMAKKVSRFINECMQLRDSLLV